jgi:hypothetical protein
MAAPVDSARQGTNITTAATSHEINVGSPAAGTLLVVAVRFAADPGTVAFTGYFQSIATNGDASDDDMRCFLRTADGTEGATDTLTTTNSVKLAAICWEITGADGQILSSTSATFTTVANTADPGSVVTGVTREYLWLAIAGQDGEVGAYTGAPTTPSAFQNLVTANSGTGGAAATNCYMGGASLQSTAATLDPGAFTHGAATTGGMAWTLAVVPLAAVIPSLITPRFRS